MCSCQYPPINYCKAALCLPKSIPSRSPPHMTSQQSQLGHTDMLHRHATHTRLQPRRDRLVMGNAWPCGHCRSRSSFSALEVPSSVLPRARGKDGEEAGQAGVHHQGVHPRFVPEPKMPVPWALETCARGPFIWQIFTAASFSLGESLLQLPNSQSSFLGHPFSRTWCQLIWGQLAWLSSASVSSSVLMPEEDLQATSGETDCSAEGKEGPGPQVTF